MEDRLGALLNKFDSLTNQRVESGIGQTPVHDLQSLAAETQVIYTFTILSQRHLNFYVTPRQPG
jgi:hypothetical protein